MKLRNITDNHHGILITKLNTQVTKNSQFLLNNGYHIINSKLMNAQIKCGFLKYKLKNQIITFMINTQKTYLQVSEFSISNDVTVSK